MSHCPFCKKKIAMSKAFCSRNCKENYFQLIAIQIPKLFLKRIYVFCSEEEREKEIIEFASRHKWRLDLLRQKIEEEAIKSGYIEDTSKDS
jgi:predicted nucleic acid-binding Zn ribbon protein